MQAALRMPEMAVPVDRVLDAEQLGDPRFHSLSYSTIDWCSPASTDTAF